MNIVIIGAIDPDNNCNKIGGTRTYIINLLSTLKNYEIGVTLIGIAYRKIIKPTDFKFIPISFGKSITSFDFFIKLFIKSIMLPISRKSIIHVQRAEDLVPFFIFFPNNPKVCTLHGIRSKKEISDQHGRIIGSLIEQLTNIGLNHANKIIVVDEKTRQLVMARNPSIESKIVVIPSGVNHSIFRQLDKKLLRIKYGFEQKDRIILYVGRFDKVKGIDFLIKAFKVIQSQMLNSKLVLVGDGPEKRKLKSLANDVSSVIFMGTLNRSKISEIMNCADVFALCSLREGMPTVVLEAMACGLPVVSTDVGDVRKVVKNDVTGYIMMAREEKEISDKLKSILINSNGFSQNCINVAKEYSKEKVAESILKVYNEVLEKK